MYSKYKDYLEQPQRELKTWKAALYIRLSREDGDKSESYSITSQREILKEYLKLHPNIEAHDFVYGDQHMSVTISIGVATLQKGKKKTPSGLVDLADQALYISKESGRNRSSFAPNQ